MNRQPQRLPPSLVKTEQTFAWTTGKMRARWTPQLHHRAFLYLSVCIVHQETMTFFRVPATVRTAVGTHRGGSGSELNCNDGQTRQWGRQKHLLTLTQTHTHTHTHTSACIQMHNHTQRHSNILLYICTVYPLCIVPDAVLCMLTCRWNVTIIHRRDWAGRPSQWVDSLSQCKLFVSFTSPHFAFGKCMLTWLEWFDRSRSSCARSSSAERWCWWVLNPLEGTHNLPLMTDRTQPQWAWVGEEKMEGKLGRSN